MKLVLSESRVVGSRSLTATVEFSDDETTVDNIESLVARALIVIHFAFDKWAVPAAYAAAEAAAAAPAAQPAAGDGDAVVVEATGLSWETRDGKVYWKVNCGRWEKFGVRIWPEALPESLKKVDTPFGRVDIKGWEAVVKMEGDKPLKVVALRNVG